jgi:hypothetical protein
MQTLNFRARGRVACAALVMACVMSGSAAAQKPAPAPAPESRTPAKALPPAREVIDRHIKAIGGREALLAHTSSHATGTFSVPSAGMTGSVEIYNAAKPDRIVTRISIGGIGDITNGFDGVHGWILSPMTGPMLQQGKELDEARLDAAFYGELRQDEHYRAIRTVEKTDFEGRPCYKVSLLRRDGVEDFDFYDVETGLKAGSITTRETPMGTVTATSVVSDYRKFANLLQPTKLTNKSMGVEQTITIGSVDFDKVDPSVFELPAPIKALIK